MAASAVSAAELAGAQWVIPETALFVLGGEENILGRGAYGEVRVPGQQPRLRTAEQHRGVCGF